MRYEKHWRHKKKDLERTIGEMSSGQVRAAVQAMVPRTGTDLTSANVNSVNQYPPTSSATRRITSSPSPNQRVDNLRVFGAGKVVPVPEKISKSDGLRVTNT